MVSAVHPDVPEVLDMSTLRLTIAMSLDGYVAGPNQSVEEPLGIGGEALHEWAFKLEFFQAIHGRTGGEVNATTPVAREWLADVGATIMGRNMFGGHPGPWDEQAPWRGWWGEDPPYQHPVFVLTHHPREPLQLGDTTFTFVTDGIESALEQARAAAGDGAITLAGGAKAAQQYLAAGLVDEAYLNVAPILLGGGERLFDNVGTDLHGLELERAVDAPGVVHLIFRRA